MKIYQEKKLSKNQFRLQKFKISLPIIILLLLIITIYQKRALYKQSISFSLSSGLYEHPQELILSNNYNKGQIFYTTDGSEPSSSSNLYKNPIQIDDTAIIRTAIFNKDEMLGEIKNKSYLVTQQDYDFPIVSFITDPVNLWDPNHGIYLGYSNKDEQNYNKIGPEYVRPFSMDFFDEEKKLAFSTSGNFKIHGGGSRRNPQKAFKLCSTNDRALIEYKLFPGNEQSSFNCILLRSAGNDYKFAVMRDSVFQRAISKDLNVETQDSQIVHAYINGEYWGIYRFRPAYTNDYFSIKYAVSKNDIAILFPDGTKSEAGLALVADGSKEDKEKYDELFNYIQSGNMSRMNKYEKVSEKIDIENLIDYLIAQLYFNNRDWPWNNSKFYIYKGSDISDLSVAPLDGKYRWLIYDLDMTFGFKDIDNHGKEKNFLISTEIDEQEIIDRSQDKPILERLTEHHQFTLGSLLDNDNHKWQFISRFADLLNTTLSPDNIIKEISAEENILENNISLHINRWRHRLDIYYGPTNQNVDEWRSNVDFLKVYAQQRADFLRNSLVEHFKLDNIFKLNLNVNNSDYGSIQINTLLLNKNLVPFEGYYFSSFPVFIKAEANPGYKFKEWKGLKTKELEFSTTFAKDTSITAIFEKE